MRDFFEMAAMTIVGSLAVLLFTLAALVCMALVLSPLILVGAGVYALGDGIGKRIYYGRRR